MTITAIVIITLAIAMMLGPLLLMQPSHRQQQLAGIRNMALSLGLKVQLRSYHNQNMAFYHKPWPSDDGRQWGSKEWCLQMKDYSHEIHFSKFWDWESGKQSPEICCDAIRSLLIQIPQGVTVIEATKLGISCCWDERGGQAVLEKINQILTELSFALWPISSR